VGWMLKKGRWRLRLWIIAVGSTIFIPSFMEMGRFRIIMFHLLLKLSNKNSISSYTLMVKVVNALQEKRKKGKRRKWGSVSHPKRRKWGSVKKVNEYLRWKNNKGKDLKLLGDGYSMIESI
jgi:hypothetical protein